MQKILQLPDTAGGAIKTNCRFLGGPRKDALVKLLYINRFGYVVVHP